MSLVMIIVIKLRKYECKEEDQYRGASREFGCPKVGVVALLGVGDI
jgi:hypothetical protein